MLCVVSYRSLRRADHSSRGVLPIVGCLSVISKPRKGGCPDPLRMLSYTKCIILSVIFYSAAKIFLEVLYNKTIQINQFPKFTPAWNSTCFGQFLCPSSGVYSLYTGQWYMSYRFVESFRSKAVYKPVWHIPVPSVQWIKSWWWQRNCPKHIEFHAGVNLGNWCIWLVLL